MTSDSKHSGLFWRGIIAAAVAGGYVGLADVVRALVSGREVIQAHDAFDVVFFYGACFAPCGLIAVLAARLFDRPRRALELLVIFGAAFFFVGAWLNVSRLPNFTGGLSITVDVVLLVAAALGFRLCYRGTARAGMRIDVWFIAGVVAIFLTFVASKLHPGRGEGPAPEARVVAGAKRPNVLVYLCDTLGADHLGCYGYDRGTSAEIDAFAKDATVFADCRSVTSWTKPSVASLLTSLYPTVHGCVEQRRVLAPGAETMAEVFRAAGWRTGAFVDNPFISPEFGFGQGFAAKDYHYVPPSVVANGTLLGTVLFMTRVRSYVVKQFGMNEHLERGTVALHAEFLNDFGRPGGEPWFAYIHAMDPHVPYEPSPEDATAFGLPPLGPFLMPPAYNGILPYDVTPALPVELLETLTKQYDAEIRGFSRGFGILISELATRGILENTIVVVVGDHGEEFHEHGAWKHGHSLHREVTQVPFIVRLPAVLGDAALASRGVRIGGVATLLDVFPTLLDLCSIRYPRGAERGSGSSFVTQIIPAEGCARFSIQERVLLGEVSTSPGGIRSIRKGRWQLIVARKPPHADAIALYDDVSDSQHVRNEADELPLVAQALRAEMDAAFGELGMVAVEGGDRAFDPDTARRLRSLGYVGGK